MKNIKEMEGTIRKKLELLLAYTLGIKIDSENLNTSTEDMKNTKNYYLLYLERVRRNNKHLYVLEKFNTELLNIYIYIYIYE
ncbi:hypothetical protein ALNOE001_02820 [Candidatus Methanobinarius endosymbioticus]|uniref:Uncharacterized protein n=1 Tax=Candidatus Methanobinarius endosymbioticus TaxID=2006182 RepID=A0A366MFJ2_9EURY|nr:hypothetical protein ALNOE001_02820 [Candidatus Methanobinarius endosymbioticus]